MNGSEALETAIDSAVPPTAESACFHQSAKKSMPTTDSAPTRLPTYTILQFRRSRSSGMRRLTQLIVIRLFPVNSSAPADDDQDEAEGKGKARQQLRGPVAERRPGGHDGREHGPQGDERAREDAQHKRRRERGVRLGHAPLLRPAWRPRAASGSPRRTSDAASSRSSLSPPGSVDGIGLRSMLPGRPNYTIALPHRSRVVPAPGHRRTPRTSSSPSPPRPLEAGGTTAGCAGGPACPGLLGLGNGAIRATRGSSSTTSSRGRSRW